MSPTWFWKSATRRQTTRLDSARLGAAGWHTKSDGLYRDWRSYECFPAGERELRCSDECMTSWLHAARCCAPVINSTTFERGRTSPRPASCPHGPWSLPRSSELARVVPSEKRAAGRNYFRFCFSKYSSMLLVKTIINELLLVLNAIRHLFFRYVVCHQYTSPPPKRYYHIDKRA